MNIIKKAFKCASNKSSLIIWSVTITHLLSGFSFLLLDINMAFFNSYSFLTFFAFNNPTHQHIWGVVFITVALLSVASDFIRQTWSSMLLIPQQILVMYGFFELLITVIRYGAVDFFWLTLCLLGPVAFMHTIAVIKRCKTTEEEHEIQVIEQIKQIIDENIPD